MTLYSLRNKKTYIEIMKGIATHFPFLNRLAIRNTGGSDSPRYCYSVWLRHLCMAHKNGLSVRPEIVAELGPGDSLGIGIAALLTGAKKYYAFDVVKYASDDRNIRNFEELVVLFNRRENIPMDSELPGIRPDLDSYKFPHDILDSEYLNKMMTQERLQSIKKAIMKPGQSGSDGIEISYIVPWNDMSIVRKESVDMIVSQAVLEHAENLETTYNSLYGWLRPGAYMSHQIDFTSNGTSDKWNGHWAYPDYLWKVILGKRPYPLNRRQHSSHINYLRKIGFEIVCDEAFQDDSGIQRNHLASEFKDISEEDLYTAGAFVQAVKSSESEAS